MKEPFTPEEDAIITRISEECVRLAMKGASLYLRAHKLNADADLLKEAIKARLDTAIEEGFTAMSAAIAANMPAVGAATFQMTMVEAGAAAAKEVGHL